MVNFDVSARRAKEIIEVNEPIIPRTHKALSEIQNEIMAYRLAYKWIMSAGIPDLTLEAQATMQVIDKKFEAIDSDLDFLTRAFSPKISEDIKQ